MENSPIALLYQSGYLTIKDYDERFGTYMLGFPNREVEEGFTRYLVPYYTPLKKEQTVTFVKGFVKDVEEGEPEKFMSRLEALFANGNYQTDRRLEKCRMIVYLRHRLFLLRQATTGRANSAMGGYAPRRLSHMPKKRS